MNQYRMNPSTGVLFSQKADEDVKVGDTFEVFELTNAGYVRMIRRAVLRPKEESE